jgi:hypothetical protein
MGYQAQAFKQKKGESMPKDVDDYAYEEMAKNEAEQRNKAQQAHPSTAPFATQSFLASTVVKPATAQESIEVGKMVALAVNAGSQQVQKDTSGKLPLGLIDPLFLKGLAKALHYGASVKPRANGEKGYGPWNWAQGEGLSYKDMGEALLRHFFEWYLGNDIDPESGLEHLEHLAANAMFLYCTIKRNKGKDDRPHNAIK